MSQEEDDIPPLEDLSHVVQKCVKNNEGNANNNPSGYQQSFLPESITTNSSPCSNKTPTKSQSSFGGFQKGFLANSSKKPTVTAAKGDFIEVKVNQKSTEDSLVLPEVQEAMGPSSQNQWMTEDFMKQISQDKEVVEWLLNPSTSQILTDFQKDPSSAKWKYRDQPVVLNMFTKLAGLLGNHFLSLPNNAAEQSPSDLPHAPSAGTPLIEEIKNKSTTAPSKKQPIQQALEPRIPDALVHEVLNRPGVKEALCDAEVQRIIELLKNDPKEAQRAARHCRPDVQRKLHTLISNGVIGCAM